MLYDLKKLMQATEQTIGMARKAKKHFASEAINWGDLHCIDAQFCTHADVSDSYVVLVEEAAPDSWEFCRFISEELYHMGFENIEVRTEW